MKNNFIRKIVLAVVVASLCALCALAVGAAEYTLYVGNVQVTSENASDVFGDGTVSYDETTSTLYLKGANIEGYYNVDASTTAALYAKQSIKIDVLGENSLTNNSTGAEYAYGIYFDAASTDVINIVKNDVDALTVTSAPAVKESVGLKSKGMFLVDVLKYTNSNDVGTLILTFVGDDANRLSAGVYTYDLTLYRSNLVLTSGNVNCTDSSVEEAVSAGLYVENSLVADYRYDITATSGNVESIGNAVSAAVYTNGAVETKRLCSDEYNAGDAITKGSGTYAISAGFYHPSDVDIVARDIVYTVSNGGNAYAANGSSKAYSYGFYTEGFYNMHSSSKLTATAKEGKTHSVGVYADEISIFDLSENEDPSFFISASSVATEESEICTAVYVNNKIANTVATYSKTGEECSYDEETCIYVVNGNAAKDIYFEPLCPVCDGTLYVGGILVTEDNANDILGDGKVRYDYDSRTLYLDNAEISGSYEFATGMTAAIYSNRSINISVSGDCFVVSDAEGSAYDYALYADEHASHFSIANDYHFNNLVYVYGKDSSANITFESANAEKVSYGLYNKLGDIYINGVSVNVYSGSSGEVTGCMYAVSTTNYGLHLPEDDKSSMDTSIRLYGTLTINNAKLNVVCGDVINPVNKATAYAIHSNTFNINGECEINAEGGNIENALANAESVAIMSGSTTVSDCVNIVAVGGDVTGNGNVKSIGLDTNLYLLNENEDSIFYCYGGDVSILSESDGTVCEALSTGYDGSLTMAGNNKMFCYGGDCSVVGDEDTSDSYGFNGSLVEISGTSYVYGEGGSAKTVSAGVFTYGLEIIDNAEFYGVADKDCGAESLIGVQVLYFPLEGAVIVDQATNSILTFAGMGMGYLRPDGTPSPEASIVTSDIIAYDVIVGGVQITNENKEDVFGDGTVSFDPETNTLTLNNANVSGSSSVAGLGTAAISTAVPLTVVVNGTNTVTTGTEGSAIDMGIVYYGSELEEGEAAITIKGSSKSDVLNVTTSDALGATVAIGTSSGDIVFEKVTVNAEGGEAGEFTYGIISGLDTASDVYVDGAIVNVKAGDVTAYEGLEVGASIGAAADDVFVENHGELNVISGDVTAPYGGTSLGVQTFGNLCATVNSSVTAEGGSITETSGEEPTGDSISAGILCEGTITANYDSTIKGTGNDTTGLSAGVYGYEIELPDGTVTGKSTATSTYIAVGLATVSEPEGTAALDTETGNELGFVADVLDGVGAYADENGNFSKETTAVTFAEFDIWVGGVRVTTLNMDDVLGDGTVSYNESDNILTLDNANITGSYQFTSYAQSASAVIYSAMPMKILVKGESRIVSGVYGNKDDYGIYCSVEDNDSNSKTAPIYDFKIYGEDENSSLYVESKDAETSTTAIQTSEINLVIEDLKLTAVAGGARDASALLGTNASISILNSKLELSTGNAGQFNYGIGSAFDIYVYSSDIEIVTGNVEADDNAALNIGLFSLKTVDVDASNVTINIGNTESIEYGTVSTGIFTAKTVIADNSVLDITCGDADGKIDSENISCGVFSTEGVIFEDGSGTISVKLNCDNSDAVIATIYSMMEVENGTVRDGVSGELLEYDSETKTYVDANGNVSKNVVATGGIILFGDYNLFVGNVIVTEENKDDIFGDLDGEGATAYYDDKTNTLYLDNANITTCLDINGDGSLVAAVARVGSLNVSLIGENRVEIENLENTPYMMIGVGAAGGLNITSEKYATLEIVNCDSIEQNLALVTMAFTGNERYLDLNISGYANVTARAGDVAYMDSGVSAGVLSAGSLSVTDKASLYGYGAAALRDEESTASPGGISAGIVSEETLLVNTTGEVYGKSAKSDSMAMGVLGASEIKVVNGMLSGDATSEMAQGAISAGVVTSNSEAPENVVVYAGASEDTLSENVNFYYESSYYLATYLYDGDNIGLYTVMLPEEGLAGLGTTTAVPENGEDEEDDDIISVFVTGYDDAIIAFASYDVNGRMIDMRYMSSAVTADEFGRVTCDTLVTDGAVRIKCFMFDGNALLLKPLCEELERYI